MKRLTQKEFENRVYDLYKDEYSVIGEYVSGHTQIRLKHNICGWVYEADPYNFLNGHGKCPICFPKSKKINHSAFVKKVENLCGKEYSVVSEYTGANKPITMRHNNCSCEEGVYEWQTTPHNFLDGNHKCPYESRLYLDIDEVKRRLASFHPEYTCVTEEYVCGKDIEVMCDKGHIYTTDLTQLSTGHGCPYCCNQKLLVGYNDLWTTHSDIARYLLDPQDGYRCIYGTKKEYRFKCPECGEVFFKQPSIALSSAGKLICKCNDGISYPEKYVTSLFRQLNIEYYTQLSKKTYAWCGDYRYDFYIPANNLICEVHGMQHYKKTDWYVSLEYVQLRDAEKEKIALSHIDKYVVIDARFSNPEYIKNSIEHTILAEIYDLSNIDWEKCSRDANSSLVVKAGNLWNDGIHNAVQIGSILGIGSNTVLNYLEHCAFSGLCEFDRQKYQREVNHGSPRIKVECVETGIIYNSYADVNKQLNIKLSTKKINTNNKIGGFHWRIVDN